MLKSSPSEWSARGTREPWVAAVVAAACFGAAPAVPGEVSFNGDIRPLLSNACFRCHGPDEAERKAGLRLDTREGAVADNDGVRAVVPGDPGASELLARIASEDPDEVMPPPEAGKPLSPDEVALIARWIDEGAGYETHWSYVRPERPEVPDVAAEVARDSNEIDAFVLERLEAEGLALAPEADRRTIARRVALDLVGLPPEPREVDAFAADREPGAYGRFVDRQLARPAFGEHWARMWLDLARYADSAGYADDPPRTIWAYRDWVVRAFNGNMPFDRFTVEQLAGDLLGNPTPDQVVATGFHRNTQTNNEGGTDDEEFRNVAVVDRVNTTMATWMGTTMSCAQCHTHKYDPITHNEYFQMFAIFNQSADADRKDESPTVPVFAEAQRERRAALQREIAELEAELESPSAANLEALAAWERGLATREAVWEVVEPPAAEAEAESGAEFSALGDGSLLVGGASAETDVYRIGLGVVGRPVTALRLEVLSHESLGGGGGPGREGNFVLNDVALEVEPSSPVRVGRFVRIDLPGKGKTLHLAEVEVFSGGENVAPRGAARQSGDYADAVAARAIDGNTDGAYENGSVAHAASNREDPFWEVDLGSEVVIDRVVVWNRTDNGLQARLDGFRLSVLDAERQPVWSREFGEAPEREVAAEFGRQRAGFRRATSSFDQRDFGVAEAIDGSADSHSGWAVAPMTGRAHTAVFELDAPLPPGQFVLTLRQDYGRHAIGRFRVALTSAAEPPPALPVAVVDALSILAENRTPEQLSALLAQVVSEASTGRAKRLVDLRAELASIEPATTVPVMRELPGDKHRRTFVHLRGNHLSPGEEVTAGLPAAFHPLPEGSAPDRLGLARWLVDRDNPLTARVVANRFWEQVFGIGLVATSEEFGSQGEPPSHPELLDWLAVELMDGGWDVKAFLKRLVTSATYRQESAADPALVARDPDNRLLARGPRVRLSAEMVRDQALAVSGLLSSKMFGEPVRPPQPDLGLKAAFGGGIDWKTSDGEDRYRRGIYTTWRRSNPYPSMAAFDAPNREVCTVRRDLTNTPLQALVTLNDPVYVEAAQSLARRMAEVSGDPREAIGHGFELCLLRPPAAAEMERLAQLHAEALARYRADAGLAAAMATDPLGPAPDGADVAGLAALTVVGSVLLNLDEFLMKR